MINAYTNIVNDENINITKNKDIMQHMEANQKTMYDIRRLTDLDSASDKHIGFSIKCSPYSSWTTWRHL